MRSLAGVGDKFYEPIRIVGGARTRARIQRTSDGDQPGAEFSLPTTTLRVDRKSIIQSGMVVQLPGDELFLVADHSQTGQYRTHHLFPADREVTWTRRKTKADPVTKLTQPDGEDDLGTIWVMWERTRREFMDLSLRIAQENYLVATGAAVAIGDYVDGKLVRRVSLAMGVRVLELQG